MPRPILPEAQIHPAVREKIATYRSDIVKEVQAAVAANEIVVVGMRHESVSEEGEEARSTRPGSRTSTSGTAAIWASTAAASPLKLWTGWPTFPMVFVKGVLVGGADDLVRLIEKGELGREERPERALLHQAIPTPENRRSRGIAEVLNRRAPLTLQMIRR